MTFKIHPSALTLGALFCAACLSLAAQGTAPAAAKPEAPAAAKPNAAAPSPRQQKPVDINHASKDALLQLPGLSPALADKIIAGRPYLSKANLITRNIIPSLSYQLIRTRIYVVARVPAKKKKK
jgi:DNA uptake protein ComE-like DNA-binding protein